MGVDTGASSGSYGYQPHPYDGSGPSTYPMPTQPYPMPNGNTNSIDLTQNAPQKKPRASRKRKAAVEYTEVTEKPVKKRAAKSKAAAPYADDEDDVVVVEKTVKRRATKRKAAAEYADEDDDDDAPVKKPKAKDEEKRLKRFRKAAPVAYSEIRHRALTQRMFVIDRQRSDPIREEGSLVEHPTETVKLAGTTGNVYTITIDRVPSCNCPHANKGNQCKHVVYVLSRVLRCPSNLEYQLAFLSSELRDIFDKAPPLPSETADESEKDGKRKKVEGECPICVMDFEPDNENEQIVYCKAACGNNIHKECFDQWARTKRGGAVTCPFCRTPWQQNEGQDMKNIAQTGELNEEGYVNVAGQLGLSGERDYSTYHSYWVRRQFGGDYYD